MGFYIKKSIGKYLFQELDFKKLKAWIFASICGRIIRLNNLIF
jgi:hypothetical protein